MCDFSQARGHGWECQWEFGILAPLHQITPHTARATLFWALFLPIYISSLMPPHLFLFSFYHQFLWVPTNCHKCPNLAIMQRDEMQNYRLKLGEVLDSGWYLFVCWLHMFGSRFPGFAGFPPGESDTLHSRLILSRHHSSTHLKNVWNIKQQARISAFVDDIWNINMCVLNPFLCPKLGRDVLFWESLYFIGKHWICLKSFRIDAEQNISMERTSLCQDRGLVWRDYHNHICNTT